MAKAKKDKKVWIKTLVSMAGRDMTAGKGAVIEVDKEEAQRLISAGLAEATTAPQDIANAKVTAKIKK